MYPWDNAHASILRTRVPPFQCQSGRAELSLPLVFASLQRQTPLDIRGVPRNTFRSMISTVISIRRSRRWNVVGDLRSIGMSPGQWGGEGDTAT